MNKVACAVVSIVLSLSLALVAPPMSHAETGDNSLCHGDVAFFFMNGVQTTTRQARFALDRFQVVHGPRAATTGDRIRYDVLYNYSAGFEDFVETFEQRLLEHEGLLEGRFELFFEALRGEGSWWSNIVTAVSSTVNLLESFVDWAKAAAVEQLMSLAGSPPTIANYAAHRTRIDSMIVEGHKLLFVAHSQGNLFANAAYRYAVDKVGANAVKVVHIAPASPALSGPHTLANLDLVINVLRLAGSAAANTDDIPPFIDRPPGSNGGRDILGHGLLEIYINPGLALSERVKGHIEEALNSLVAPAAQGTSGFFTATLTWDGAGDVDLHTDEPGDGYVYYRARTGNAGYLDVDNRVGEGPEHYYATCDRTKLLEGTYRIKVANYERADGRTATVQIASWSDGVLGTKSVVLGGATRDTPAFDMFDVVVQKNPQTGRFTVALE